MDWIYRRNYSLGIAIVFACIVGTLAADSLKQDSTPKRKKGKFSFFFFFPFLRKLNSFSRKGLSLCHIKKKKKEKKINNNINFDVHD